MITVTLLNGSTAQFPEAAQALKALQSEVAAATKKITALTEDLALLNPTDPCTPPHPSPL